MGLAFLFDRFWLIFSHPNGIIPGMLLLHGYTSGTHSKHDLCTPNLIKISLISSWILTRQLVLWFTFPVGLELVPQVYLPVQYEHPGMHIFMHNIRLGSLAGHGLVDGPPELPNDPPSEGGALHGNRAMPSIICLTFGAVYPYPYVKVASALNLAIPVKLAKMHCSFITNFFLEGPNVSFYFAN